MTELFISRMNLRADAATRTLWDMLNPDDTDRALDAHHKLIWSVFANGDAAQARDFLWRHEIGGRFIVLSHRPPSSDSGLMDIETKPFEPHLTRGDRLRFVLRANATMDRARGQASDGGGRRVDVVMHALFHRDEKRSEVRMGIARQEGFRWLSARAERSGFALDQDLFHVDHYAARRMPRKRGGPASFGVMDMAGLLTVTDETAFLAAIGGGFGRAKAFGCGLMLIRRA